MTWGIKVSKPGFDVKTATDDQLVMSSEYSSLKVAHTDAPTTSGTYTHGLGYTPAFIVSGSGYFVGQEYSNVELTFASDATSFYYYGACRYWIFYQDTL